MFYFSNYSEVIYLNSWNYLQQYVAADTTQQFLYNCYQKKGFEDAEKKAYENCYAFIYYLEQGEVFYQQVTNTPLSIKPLLLYYGLIHLIKACLLAVDPSYPNTTSVLAHGVSTRKRKKRQYQFIQDEVKIQKNGLCNFFTTELFQLPHLEGEKFKMADLLYLVVELEEMYQFFYGETNMIPLIPMDEGMYAIPQQIEENYFMNQKRVQEYITTKAIQPLQWDSNFLKFPSSYHVCPPFRYHLAKQQIYLPAKIHPFPHLPDLLIHYLLLYNLSMIARYETEWWLELIKTTPNIDFPFIRSFLHITEMKGPFLVQQILSNLN